MSRKRYTDEDVLKLLREIDVHLHDGLDVVSACRKAGYFWAACLRRDTFSKALASRRDIVRVKLEDGIAPKDKAEARQKAFEAWSSTIIKRCLVLLPYSSPD